ncbi:MAG: transcription termination factor Rho [Lachnospiraceae bacterium]|nr:transcription termination factor Rho [Lachnospiraceae bacterium]
MREKWETLSLTVLRDIAKGIGVKGYSTMKKDDLVTLLVEEEEKKNKAATATKEQQPKKAEDGKESKASEQKPSAERSIPAEKKAPAEKNAAPEKKESEEKDDEMAELDSKIPACGILEVMPDGFGFIRCENYLPGEHDVYVAPGQIRKFGLKTGDIIEGSTKIKTQNEKFSALLFVKKINGYTPEEAIKRANFEDMTPIFPDDKIHLDIPGAPVSMRIMDLISPVGKGQRGMIVSPPKAGKTTLLKAVAKCVKYSNPDMHMIILLIDERPEEVTDIKEAIQGPNVEVIYSTFDETPEHHKRVAEMVIERAKRLVEHKKDVVILLDSITRLTRAYNQVIPPSGRTLSGGLDPAALHMPKRFFGAARNMREGGSLTILATALVDTGSKMDDVVYEEFKGTGNMEMVLDRKLSEKRVFPAIDIPKSGTRREDLLLTPDEMEAINILRKAFNGLKPEEAADKAIDLFSRTRNNREFVDMVKKMKWF